MSSFGLLRTEYEKTLQMDKNSKFNIDQEFDEEAQCNNKDKQSSQHISKTQNNDNNGNGQQLNDDNKVITGTQNIKQ